MSTFYEFFAGGGMARMGLGPEWQCLFANDWNEKKGLAYVENWGTSDFKLGDINNIQLSELPGRADLVWSSFPCQDLSLAGKGAGLKGKRSGVFWSFWKLMLDLAAEERKPKIIVLENVAGLLNSNQGRDFGAIAEVFSDGGYRFGAVVADAAFFLPQSRVRLFIIAVDKALPIPDPIKWIDGQQPWHTKPLMRAYNQLPEHVLDNWIWWKMPLPKKNQQRFIDIIEDVPKGVAWHSQEDTDKILGMMSEAHLAKVRQAVRDGRKAVGAIYKRMRPDGQGERIQRAEVRFDDTAGCLRTPSGGSSRQIIMLIEKGIIRTRLLSPREAARLMGLPDDYKLPERYNDAYHLVGDGVAVPVVAHLEKHLFRPILTQVTAPVLEFERAA